MALLLLAAAAPAAGFDDAGVVLAFKPENLWRTPAGAFSGVREGDRLVLTYDFFGEGDGYSKCPARGARCEDAQRAVGEAFKLWADASGRLSVRRRSGAERVNVWISWTTKIRPTVAGTTGPRGLSVDDTRDAASVPPPVDPGARGFARPGRPDARKEYGSLFFNDKFCWFVDDESACPPAENPTGMKSVSRARPVRATSLHEGGHVLGFGHFYSPSIMGVAGGTERYELNALDREAIRRLYDAVGR